MWRHVKVKVLDVVATFCTYFDHQPMWIFQERAPHPLFFNPIDRNSQTPNVISYTNLSKSCHIQSYCCGA